MASSKLRGMARKAAREQERSLPPSVEQSPVAPSPDIYDPQLAARRARYLPYVVAELEAWEMLEGKRKHERRMERRNTVHSIDAQRKALANRPSGGIVIRRFATAVPMPEKKPDHHNRERKVKGPTPADYSLSLQLWGAIASWKHRERPEKAEGAKSISHEEGRK